MPVWQANSYCGVYTSVKCALCLPSEKALPYSEAKAWSWINIIDRKRYERRLSQRSDIVETVKKSHKNSGLISTYSALQTGEPTSRRQDDKYVP